MGKLKQTARFCTKCHTYYNPPNRKVELWFRESEVDTLFCGHCSDKTMAELTAKLDAEKKKVRVITDLSGKRLIALTHPSDYLERTLLKPDSMSLVEKVTEQDLKDVLQK